MLSAGDDGYVSKWMSEGGQKYPQVSDKSFWTNVSGGLAVRAVLILPNKTTKTFDSGEDASTFGGDISAFTTPILAGGITKPPVSATKASSQVARSKGLFTIAGMNLNFGSEMKHGMVSLFSFDGQMQGSRTIAGTSMDLSTFGLSSGAYLIRAVSPAGDFQILKIVIQ